MVLLKGETARHIQKCYPPGREGERQPVPNELSQLIFYLQAHRSKIAKFAHVLEERAAHFSSRGKFSSLIVTAYIMDEVVVKLSTDFSLFEEAALAVVELLLARGGGSQGDADALMPAKQLFAHYAEHNKGVHFLGNPSYCRRFIDVVVSWSHLASTAIPAAKVVALDALAALAKSPSLDTNTGLSAVSEAMPGILANLPTNVEDYSLNADNTAGSNVNDVVHTHAAHALQCFLSSNSFRQTHRVVESLLPWLAGSAHAPEQKPQVLASIAVWVPPQNRFLVTKDVIQAMCDLPLGRTRQCLLYCDCLGALLGADFAKVDLSVVDTLQQLARLQRRFLEAGAAPNGNASDAQLVVDKLKWNVGLLASMHVYPGQCNDMLSVILARYVDMSPAEVPSTAEIVCDLRNVLEIITSETHTETRTLYASIWEGTQWLLTLQHPQPVALYATCFRSFFALKPSSVDLTLKRGSLVFRQLLTTLLSPQLAPANCVAVYYCLVAQIEFFGRNSSNLLTWLFETARRKTEGDDNTKVCCASALLASLLAILRVEERTQPASVVFNYIQSKVGDQRWLPGITYPLTAEPLEAIQSVAGASFSFGAPAEEQEYYPAPETLLLTTTELAMVSVPPFDLAAPLDPEDVRAGKGRAPSITGRNRTASVRSRAPSVADSHVVHLRRKQTEMLTLRTPKRHVPEAPVHLPHQSPVELLKKISMDSLPRGTLTV